MLAFSQFVSEGLLIAHHHVVVLETKGDYALILPTDSLHAESHRAQAVAGEIGRQDRELAGWPNRCRWQIGSLQWVPMSWVKERPGVRLTKETMAQLKLVAKSYGPKAPRHSEEQVSQLVFRGASKDKQRIRAV